MRFSQICGKISQSKRGSVSAMTAKEAIRELEHMKQYSTAKAIPALDCAIKALKEKAEREKE